MTEQREKSTRNKGILAIEERLTYLAENDPRNDEMYILLKKLAYIYINQNKFVYGYDGVEEVVHDVAADTWMNVLAGRKIYAWIYYIGKMIKLSYVPNQKRIEHETIDTGMDPYLKDNIKRMCASSSISCTEEFDKMQRRLMLDNIDSLIETTLNKTKFKKGTKEWLSLYTNVCLNLVREIDGDKPLYFRIDNGIKPYVHIVMEQFKKEFRNSGFNDSIMDNVDADLEMQLIVDESYTKEREVRK